MSQKITKKMGLVTATITVTNLVDEILQERGFITDSDVRSVTLENVIVDTGATRLCLPAPIIQQLGLTLDEEVEVKTAAGIQKARLFKRLSLSVGERKGEFNCMELPGGEDPLLGLIPLESLGLQPDIIKQQLIFLPDRGRNTYHLAL